MDIDYGLQSLLFTLANRIERTTKETEMQAIKTIREYVPTVNYLYERLMAYDSPKVLNFLTKYKHIFYPTLESLILTRMKENNCDLTLVPFS